MSELDELLLSLRQLRVLTGVDMETYAIENRLIQLVNAVSNQFFVNLLTFVGVVLAFAGVILAIQQITPLLIVLGLGIAAAIIAGALWLYREQVRQTVTDHVGFLKHELERLGDGRTQYSMVRMSIDEVLVPLVDRLLNDGEIDQSKAKMLKERFSGVTDWIDGRLKEIDEDLKKDEQELARLGANVKR